MTERLTYPYVVRTEYIPDFVARPFLPVTIRYGQAEIQTMALLDSGADINVMPYQLGLELGADWDAPSVIEDLQGLGGGVQAKRIVADLHVESWPSIGQIFAWARDDEIPVILGQIDFFQNVNVCFHRYQYTFEIEMSPGQ